MRPAAASQSDALVKAVPSVQSDAAPTHEFGYRVLSAEQKAKPIVVGDARHFVHVSKTALGGCAIALHPVDVVAAVLVHDDALARQA